MSATVQAAGYAAFANGGTSVTPHLVTKVVDARGRVVPLPWDEPGHRVLTGEQAAQATFAMRAVVTEGTGRHAALSDREAAGKTGTSDDNHAAWFVGYVPQLAASVVMTRTRSGPLEGLPGHPGRVAGEGLPSTVWRAFMANATRGLPEEVFPEPAFAGKAPNWDETATGAPEGGTPSQSPTPGASGRRSDAAAPKATASPTVPADPRKLQKWCSAPENKASGACRRP